MKPDPGTMLLEPNTFAVGTPMEGGFYVGDFHVDATKFGLIVSSKTLSERRAIWTPTYADVDGATSCCDGLANTIAMAEAGSEIARAFLDLRINDEDDWYLPSRDEQELLYRRVKPTTQTNDCTFRDGDNPSSIPVGYPYHEDSPAQTSVLVFQAGGAEAFEPEWYLTSTQYSRDGAWLQHFGDGNQGNDDKGYQALVRAVRRFRI